MELWRCPSAMISARLALNTAVGPPPCTIIRLELLILAFFGNGPTIELIAIDCQLVVTGASTIGQLPPLFFWKDSRGASLAVMYHDNYGGVTKP
jgi:hypothetical protein